jgi:hypothetical protein
MAYDGVAFDPTSSRIRVVVLMRRMVDALNVPGETREIFRQVCEGIGRGGACPGALRLSR